MKPTRRLALAALAILSGLLASCLDYREELWINANGSGKLHSTIAINSELGIPPLDGSKPDEVENQLRDIFAASDGAEVDSYQTYVDGKKRIYDFTVSFHDIRKLKPALVTGQNNIGAVFGDFEIERIPDGKLAVKRVVKLGEPPETEPAEMESDRESDLSEAIGKAFGGLLANTMLGNYHLDYVTHFPSEIVSANAPSIDRETNTVTWHYTLAEAAQGPLTMTAEIKRPGSWMIWIFVTVIALVTAAIVIPAVRKGRK